MNCFFQVAQEKYCMVLKILQQWRIQDFPEGAAPTPQILLFWKYFAENCMKMKEFGPRGARPWHPLRSTNVQDP